MPAQSITPFAPSIAVHHRFPVHLSEPLQVLEFEREAARGATKTIQQLQRENAALKYALHRQ